MATLPLLIAVATVGAPPLDAALAAVEAAPIAIFASRDAVGRPTGWPMTPYRDGDRVVLTSTLAFMHKAEAVRRDGRVAILAGGWLIQGTARVHADVSGDEFCRRFLAAELRKYPPARDIVRIPLHRWLFDWYFGRVFMTVAADRVTAVAGSDRATLITLVDGWPVITPIASPPEHADAFPLPCADGDATVLLHAEDAAMRDLRQVHLRGRVAGGVFTVSARRGSLAPAPPRGLWAALREQRELRRRGREGRRRVEAWDGQ